MFTNIIYFILALLIYQTRSIGPALTLMDHWLNGAFIFLLLLLFALEVKRRFRCLYRQAIQDPGASLALQNRYAQSNHFLMILSLIFYAAEIYLGGYKSLIALIPGTSRLASWEGALGISLYMIHLGLIWYLGYPVQKQLFRSLQSRPAYLLSQVQLNLPILFPWFLITLLTDLLEFVSLPFLKESLNHPLGEIGYVLTFLLTLAVFFPFLIKKWWQCRPIPEGPQKESLTVFIGSLGNPFREILLWPAFEGKMLTAGVMGLVKRFRYLLITPYLLEVLDPEELKGVVAHEIGHIRKRHLFFYLSFFAGYALLAVFLSQWIGLQLLHRPDWLASIRSLGAYSEDLFSIVMMAPLALGLILYFRFLFGYFMRNFERQADLFALQVLGSPRPLIQSLEKIGLYSGQSRDLPNWHHFSIGQRIAFLEQSSLNPRIGRRHQKKVLASVGLFFFLLAALGLYGLYDRTLLNPGPGGDPQALESWLGHTLRERPDDPQVLMALALLYHEQKRLTLARETYEKILRKDPHHVLALNNLAWLLVTGKDPSLYQPQRALLLALKAAELRPEPMILDTLAEAYLANGHPEQALEMIRQALTRRPSNRAYYESQREKFKQALKKNTRSE